MARQKKKKIRKTTPTYTVQLEQAVEPEFTDDEDSHVIVVSQLGLAMLVAGLRSIRDESPEVEPLLETLEEGLQKGMEDRAAKAAPKVELPGKFPWET